MLLSAFTGSDSESGGGDGGYYYYYRSSSSPQPLATRRSRPLWSNPLEFTPLPRHRARVQARDFRGRRSYGREVVIREMEVEGEEDGDVDGGDEALGLRRMFPRFRDWGSVDVEVDDGEEVEVGDLEGEGEGEGGGRFGNVRSRAAEAINGSVCGDGEEDEEQRGQRQKDPRKRKLSVMFSEAIIDIGKVIKKRADSLVWRKDSGFGVPEEPLQQQVRRSECNANRLWRYRRADW